jgi:putative transposase
MHKPRPRRLPTFSYIGFHTYFVTFCTKRRTPALRFPQAATVVKETVLAVAADHGFAVLAYCVMPDHVHLVVQGIDEAADLKRLTALSKQLTGYRLRSMVRGRLWQDGYHERVLRDGEDVLEIIRYVLENPVRAGLAQTVGEYPYAGTGVVTDAQR